MADAFVFDDGGMRAGVSSTMDRKRFGDVRNILGDQHRGVSKQEPFVGNRKAVRQGGDLKISSDAPHLDSTTTVECHRHLSIEQLRAKEIGDEGVRDADAFWPPDASIGPAGHRRFLKAGSAALRGRSSHRRCASSYPARICLREPGAQQKANAAGGHP